MVLFGSLNVVNGTQSRHFCEAFADNGFQISWGYEAEPQTSFLFIRDDYWFLEKNSNDASISLQSNSSKVNNHLFPGPYRDNYKIAIYNRICKGGRCQWMTGLWEVSH